MQASHIEDYQKLFKRVELSLETETDQDLPSDKLLELIKEGKGERSLTELYFQYGRYLLISSSRSDGLPANLQGIWNNKYSPPWSCDYHFNVNTQMLYWLAESANLSECHMPLLNFIDFLRKSGRRTARVHFGSRGWCVNWATNIWGFTTPGEDIGWGLFPEGGAWLCRHLWEHYEFTGDMEFLKSAYPIIKEACEFCLDCLIKDTLHGWLVFGPSVSPEHGYKTLQDERILVALGTAVSQEIIWELFTNCMQAAEVLDLDTEFRNELRQKRTLLAPIQIAKNGEIQEWTENVVSDGALHLRHTYAHYPGEQINITKTPELAEALRKTIEHHETHVNDTYWGIGTWFAAWMINHWSRLKEGDRAIRIMNELLKKNTAPNLFDLNTGSFQLDGNLGACAGIVELLLQSHSNEISILPALPSTWKNGYVKGLRARGGYEIDIKWQNAVLVYAQIKSVFGKKCTLRYGNKVKTFTVIPHSIYQLDINLEIITRFVNLTS